MDSHDSTGVPRQTFTSSCGGDVLVLSQIDYVVSVLPV